MVPTQCSNESFILFLFFFPFPFLLVARFSRNRRFWEESKVKISYLLVSLRSKKRYQTNRFSQILLYIHLQNGIYAMQQRNFDSLKLQRYNDFEV